jgi:protein ImuA
MTAVKKAEIIAGLQTDILRLQGFKSSASAGSSHSLGPMQEAFPNAIFPLGVIHEFLTDAPEHKASTCGFIAGLLSTSIGTNGTFLWISHVKNVFPPALKNFSLQPDRCIFIHIRSEKDLLWVMEEGLKCAALSAVVCESKGLTFLESRRLQLAVEKSQVTGFVIRQNSQKLSANACVARWRITPALSEEFDGLPGVGFPRWKVELLKIRNGKPGAWEIEWRSGNFHAAEKIQTGIHHQKRKTG